MKKRIFAAALAVATTMSVATVAFAADAKIDVSGSATDIKLTGAPTSSADLEALVFKKENAKVGGARLASYTWEACELITITCKTAGVKFQVKTDGKVLEMKDDTPDGASRDVATDAPAKTVKWYTKAEIKGSELKNNKFEIVLDPSTVENKTTAKFDIEVAISDPNFEKLKSGTGSDTSAAASGATSGGVDTSAAASDASAAASAGESGDGAGAPATGIALAVAPAALAAAFVGVAVVVSKKKKG